MPDTATRDYYASRAAAERYKADNSRDPYAAAVHREMAEHYDERVLAIDAQQELRATCG